jgi:hypothetical protein
LYAQRWKLARLWNAMPGGQGCGAGGSYLRPRGALKPGQLYLDRGRWNDKQIVDPGWVQASTRQYAQFDAAHGYAWHLHELVVMFAAGNYGDFKTWYRPRNLGATHIIPTIVEDGTH